VRFQGTSLKAKLAETPLYKGPSEYDVVIDDKPQTAPLVPNEGTADYVLATGLASGTHVVELRRRTEGQVGITQFLGFDYGGGTLLAPPVLPAHKIEFVGDSESAGYGLDCANGTESFTGATEDEPKAFPALIAAGLGAVHYNISYAGKGVLRNYDDEDTDTFAGIYVRSLPDDTESAWSFSSWVPDLVFLALGTNDYGNPDARAAPDADAFTAKYGELVALIRQKNPSAHIMCVVEPDLNDGYPAGWDAYTHVSNALKAVVAQTNDPKVHYYELPRADGSGDNGEPDLTGCDEHPNVAYDQRAATDAIAKIKAIMSW
jgi:lysophospholipase L1-like esterase